jgi:hypothetical protein
MKTLLPLTLCLSSYGSKEVLRALQWLDNSLNLVQLSLIAQQKITLMLRPKNTLTHLRQYCKNVQLLGLLKHIFYSLIILWDLGTHMQPRTAAMLLMRRKWHSTYTSFWYIYKGSITPLTLTLIESFSFSGRVMLGNIYLLLVKL